MIDKCIGLHTPYTLDEATFLACGLADYAMRLGLPITILSSQAHESRVHYRWDREVLNGRRNDFGKWASRCSHVVWFDVQKKKLAEATRLGVKNILVVLPNRLNEADLLLLNSFDALVCAQRSTYFVLRDRFKCKVVYIPWNSSRSLVTDPMRFNGKRIFVPLESKTADVIGPLIFHALRVLLDQDKEVEVTVSHTRSLTRPTLHALADLARTHKQVVLLKKPNYADLTEAYATHDWTFISEFRANVGLSALESLSARHSVIVFDTPPFNEFIEDGRHGILIPCKPELGLLGLTNKVRVNAYQVQKSFTRLLDDRLLYEKLRDESWPELVERRYHFYQGWRKLWDYDLPEQGV